MKKLLLLLLAVLVLSITVCAVEVPEQIEDVVPRELTEAAEQSDTLLRGGASYLIASAHAALKEILRGGMRSCAALMLLCLLCGALEGVSEGTGAESVRFVPYFGVLGAALLTAGDLTAFIGLGARTVDELGTLAKLLLPTVAMAMASGGCVGTASAWQVGTLMACDALVSLIREVLLPLVYCYIALAAAGAILPKSRLDALADAVKKLVTWGVSGAVVLFTAYLSVSRVLTGSADRLAVRAGSFVVSNAVPVVGKLMSEAAETLLASAGALCGTLGTLGIFAVLAVCAAPMVQLGAEFLFYQAAAFLSAMAGMETLQKFIARLSGAFALVLALTASCAMLLLAALLVSISIVL